jgi:hypothetical protein
MKKTPNQVLQFVEDFAKTNGMDIFKGMIDIDPGSQFLSITWDDAGEDGIEPFLQIAKNNSIKLLYILHSESKKYNVDQKEYFVYLVIKEFGFDEKINQISSEVPSSFSLGQNYPNPFNPITEIEYSIPIMTDVELTVYDMLGKEVIQLVKENQIAGNHRILFNADNLSSGIYYYKLTAETYVLTKKCVLFSISIDRIYSLL